MKNNLISCWNLPTLWAKIIVITTTITENVKHVYYCWNFAKTFKTHEKYLLFSNFFFSLLWKILSQDWRKEVSTVSRCQPWQSMALGHLPTGSQQRLQRTILMVRPFPITATLTSVFFSLQLQRIPLKNWWNSTLRMFLLPVSLDAKQDKSKNPEWIVFSHAI